MKKAFKRTLAMLLCVMAVFSLFPVSADAATSYSTLSSKKVKIMYPSDYYGDVMVAKIKGGTKGSGKNGVYLVPRPETGNGDMGTVKNGSKVVILAEEDGYYFFMTTSGKLGWASQKYFTEPEEVDSGYLWGSSGLTVDNIEDIKDFLNDGDCGLASKNFYASRAVLVMKKGETTKISLHRKWNGMYHISFYGSDITPKFVGSKANCKVSLKAKQKGPTTLRFYNDINDEEFRVMVVIT